MKSFLLQRVNLGSRKQRVHLAIIVSLGLLAAFLLAFFLQATEPSGFHGVHLYQRKYSVALAGSSAPPGMLHAATFKNGLTKVYALQCRVKSTFWYWEFQVESQD